LAPFFSGLTAIATYFLTKELWSSGAGLFAAAFIGIVPGYISRSVAGSYDNEGIAIFALMLTYYLWIKSVKTGLVSWSVLTALSYFYMVSAWGGYVFIINLIPLHVFVLMIIGRFSHRIYIAYSVFYVMGTILSMQIPFVGFQPIRTSEHMAASGTFALLQAYGFLNYLRSKLSKTQFRQLFIFSVIASAGLVFAAIVGLTYAGYVAPWSGRFYSLWDTGYAKIHIPIITSVSEHQPTTWTSFFFDLHFLVCIFPAGVWFCIRELNDERVFIILYALFASYFAGVMVRLILTLTPCVCVLAAIALSKTFDFYLYDEFKALNNQDNDQKHEQQQQQQQQQKSSPLYDKPISPQAAAQQAKRIANKDERIANAKDDNNLNANIKGLVVIILSMLLVLFAVHCTWVTSNAYSSPSIVLATYSESGQRQIIDDYREAYYWLRKNTDDSARIMSWWDYGYQIAGMANRTTLVDNNTWNNSHIAMVGKAMSSNESEAFKIMSDLDVDYVLVIFGGLIGYSGDDINKFLWMVRIAEGEHPRDIKESDYFTEQGEFRVDSGGSKTLLNCLMYKLSYFRFGEVQLDHRSPPGFDRTRNVEIGNKNYKLEHLEEAFTTEHWIVRIFKVNKASNRIPNKDLLRNIRRKKSVHSKKTARKRQGTINNKAVVVKGKSTKKITLTK
jgi:dolichyl-diphosphooligosaccharide--protein glycosyltransferase